MNRPESETFNGEYAADTLLICDVEDNEIGIEVEEPHAGMSCIILSVANARGLRDWLNRWLGAQDARPGGPL